MNREAVLPFCVMESVEKAAFFLLYQQAHRHVIKHKGCLFRSRQRSLWSRFSTHIPTFFHAFGLVMRTGNQNRPEALLAGMDTAFADLIILAAAILHQEEGPFHPPFFTPAHRLPCSGASRPERPFSGGLCSEHSFFASSSRSRIDGFSPGPSVSFAFSASSPRRPLLITPSIMP